MRPPVPSVSTHLTGTVVMLVIVGSFVVIGAVLAGFTWAGGTIAALIHPSELVTIGGAALGALIVMSSKKILIDLVKAVIQCLKGSQFNKAMYRELFKATYDLLNVARRGGLIALEPHVTNPHESAILKKYPKISHNHHVVEFMCGALSPVIEGTAKPEQMPALLSADLKVIEDEHHAPLALLMKTADGLPGFGIVAAVLGIVITMGAIDGPVEEIGHKVGAALVGTFLGILMSYGFFGPLATRMEFIGHEEIAFFRTISTIMIAFLNNIPPKVAIEQARRSVATEYRPKRSELDEMFKEVDSSS